MGLPVPAACGGGSGGGGSTAATDDSAASIAGPVASGGSSKASAGTDSGTGRPQLRLDTSEAEKARPAAVFFACLHDKGVPSAHKPGQGDRWFPKGVSTDHPAAWKACESKAPLQPPELDPGKNPHYMDDFRAYITCLNKGGMKVRGLADGSGWNFVSSSLSQAAQNELDRSCTMEAYGGK
ncbi:hypothetical protein [Streptomyces prunicolor]|uniref:Lipoprotein n=1 Tax=Streptomyces prunicolor TaxID=67348 RepID=A0ABU4F878_9ACTN|nr:hypothetical protein [Streptomyces prunicolor]MDV7216796.1 hypothetical protein [Streptomyces prunicolor]